MFGFQLLASLLSDLHYLGLFLQFRFQPHAAQAACARADRCLLPGVTLSLLVPRTATAAPSHPEIARAALPACVQAALSPGGRCRPGPIGHTGEPLWWAGAAWPVIGRELRVLKPLKVLQMPGKSVGTA